LYRASVELYLYSPYGPYGLYNGALYLTVELNLYFPYGPYGLYRASVPAQRFTLLFTFNKSTVVLIVSPATSTVYGKLC
jgi:hypothetical protein